jgi:hypothetical protein
LLVVSSDTNDVDGDDEREPGGDSPPIIPEEKDRTCPRTPGGAAP